MRTVGERNIFVRDFEYLGRTIGRWFGDESKNYSNRTGITNPINSQKTIPFSSSKYATLITVLGVILLDLDCDACQSPSRAYLLDVTNPTQHSLGLTTFTSMAGLGGCLGYFLGGIPWENTFLTKILGDHVHVLFTLVWIIYLVCLISTVTASREPSSVVIMAPNLSRSASRQYLVSSYSVHSMNSVYDDSQRNSIVEQGGHDVQSNRHLKISYCDYLRSIIYMPASLRWLCLTNFFCWMALVSYSLFFTDFVGQAVFGKLEK